MKKLFRYWPLASLFLILIQALMLLEEIVLFFCPWRWTHTGLLPARRPFSGTKLLSFTFWLLLHPWPVIPPSKSSTPEQNG